MNKDLIKDDMGNFIFDVNEVDFTQKVIEDSEGQLILVDFWAPWCGPCKQLGPTLEEVVNESKGKIKLAKINIDENQQIAAQLQIQSIPTVIGVMNKKIVDGFQGAVPKTKIIEFVEKIIGEKVIKSHKNFHIKIEELISAKEYEKAKDMLEDFMVENSQEIVGINNYIKCLIYLSRFDEADLFISSLDEKISKEKTILSTIELLKINKNNASSPDKEKLIKTYNDNPKDLENILKLSEKYFSENNTKEAFEILLKEFTNFKNKEKEKIRETLIKYFDALGNTHEDTKIYRKKLSTLFFS